MIDLHKLVELAEEEDTVFLGDVIDIKNAKSYTIAREAFGKLKRKMGDRYITGNHENHHEHTPVYIKDKVLFTHGDNIVHGQKYVAKWKEKLPVSKFQRPFILLQNFFVDRVPIRLGLSKKAKERAYGLMHFYDCDYLIMGHTHVKKVKPYYHKGKLIFVVPRGITEILGHKVVADVHLLGCHRSV